MDSPMELGTAIRNSGYTIREFHERLSLRWHLNRNSCYKLCRKLYRWGIPDEMKQPVDDTLMEMGVVWNG